VVENTRKSLQKRGLGWSAAGLFALCGPLGGCHDPTPEHAVASLAAPAPSAQRAAPLDTAALLRERGERSEHGSAPSFGPAGAPLTLVVFEDYASPECGRLAPLPHVLENLYAGRVHLVVRQRPSRGHERSELAAEASLAAHAQGQFWAYREMLFANPHDHSREALVRYARELGLDVGAFERSLERRELASDVMADREFGDRLRIREVPVVFANGARVSTPYGVNDLEKLVARSAGAR